MNKGGWTYRSEFVRCKKAGCRSCPHGPYWYRYRRISGKLKKEYVGREIPGGEGAAPPKTEPRRKPDMYDRIAEPRGCNVEIARTVLGLKPEEAGLRIVRAAYRQLTMLHHPDRGGDARIMIALNLAYAYLRALYQ